MKAVILAAGMGKRIRDHHTLPKGFIRLGDESIVMESLRCLKQHGITEILVVTGYGEEHYDALAKQTGLFVTAKNAAYATSGSLYSLYCAREWIDEDCLVLESDLLYEARALPAVMDEPHANVILLSGATHSRDEIYVEVRDRCLVNMSKNLQALLQTHVEGEFVGINKLSLTAYRDWMQQLEENPTLLQSGNYEEDGLVFLAKTHPVICLKMPDLLWCEIDDVIHWRRAKDIYQKIHTV